MLATDPALLAPADPPVEAILAMGWLAVVAALGPVLTVASVRLIEAARSAAFLLLNPITATILAAVLLGERPSPLQLAGGVVVLLGMAVATIPRRPDSDVAVGASGTIRAASFRRRAAPPRRMSGGLRPGACYH